MQPDDRPRAGRSRGDYVRHLPHLQRADRIYFVTFVTQGRILLPDVARDLALEHCLHDHGVRIHLIAAVVMPDHVHLLLAPLRDPEGNVYVLSEIMRGIKGASARHINVVLGRTGKLWQQESFDRMLRRDEGVRAKAEYICANPERAGLALPYRWLWRDWVEGA